MEQETAQFAAHLVDHAACIVTDRLDQLFDDEPPRSLALDPRQNPFVPDLRPGVRRRHVVNDRKHLPFDSRGDELDDFVLMFHEIPLNPIAQLRHPPRIVNE